jgi:hypothetical protein
MNNFKNSGILPANYQLGNWNNMIKVHRAFYGRLPADPIEFTPHHGRPLKNRFKSVFGITKGRKYYNAVVIAHYPSKLNSNKFMQPGGKYFKLRAEYRNPKISNARKTLGLVPKFNFLAEPQWPTRYSWYPEYRPGEPNRPNARLNAARKILPLIAQYGTLKPINFINPNNVIHFARTGKHRNAIFVN